VVVVVLVVVCCALSGCQVIELSDWIELGTWYMILGSNCCSGCNCCLLRIVRLSGYWFDERHPDSDGYREKGLLQVVVIVLVVVIVVGLSGKRLYV
jgi:hypothetical protein